jgi:rfaE bifunctional protein nucleotidyltransferase chain/domain
MTSIKDKVFSNVSEAMPIIQKWKTSGDIIVFTNGCFDLLHIGHVLYLEDAKSLGSKLIVGINSDLSVSKLKGSHRPIKDQYNRSYIMAALASVDIVIIFGEETPLEMIQSIVPNVLVKGGDWLPEQIVGSNLVLANGGQVKSLRFIEGYSTTALESKIRGFTD